MISELRIENFAIIDRLELVFKPGLTTMTGETGAGKSIILDAMEAVIGGRTDLTQIRAGAERAIVEAVFHIPAALQPAIHRLLDPEDLLESPDEITLGRELRQNGRSVARINGRTVSLGLLREVGSCLVDIHGQSEHLSLLDVRQHLGLLDRFARADSLHASYLHIYREWQQLRHELAELRSAERDADRRVDLYTFQLGEIESARLRPGEEEELKQERNRLANAENLAALVQEALALLDEGTPENPAVTDLFGQLVHALGSLARIDPARTSLSEGAATLAETAADLARSLRSYQESIEYNPRRLEEVEERLELFHNLKRKYGGSLDAVLDTAERLHRELDQITHATERIAELEEQEKRIRVRLADQAKQLSAARNAASADLAGAVEVELDDLRMAEARFAVDLHTNPDLQGLDIGLDQPVGFDETGCDRCEFLIAPNPGEGLKPLVRIASGGETSRLMLALKKVLTEADSVPTLIFDEIDQGIGGRVGMTVGEKLWQLARSHQVFCVTHLPQLAAFGDQHIRVMKLVDGGRTTTRVELLNDSNRRDELAQMLGGLSAANRSAAQEALALARQRAMELNKQVHPPQ